MIKFLFLLLPLGCFSQDLSQSEIDSLLRTSTTVYFDDTVRCNKIEVRKWIFWKEQITVAYLLKRYKDDRKTRIDFYIDDKRRRYSTKELLRVAYGSVWIDNN